MYPIFVFIEHRCEKLQGTLMSTNTNPTTNPNPNIARTLEAIQTQFRRPQRSNAAFKPTLTTRALAKKPVNTDHSSGLRYSTSTENKCNATASVISRPRYAVLSQLHGRFREAYLLSVVLFFRLVLLVCNINSLPLLAMVNTKPPGPWAKGKGLNTRSALVHKIFLVLTQAAVLRQFTSQPEY